MTRMTPRNRTADRGPPGSDDIKILEAEQIGPNMSVLPNGNLLCKAVPIARVGWMVYGPDETPIQADPMTGIAHVHRDAETLFSPSCVGSFMGVAVVDEHPDEDVTPANWKELGMGFVTTNVYRGEGADADVLLADLILTDATLIKLVQAGKREVSCGYDADYKQTGPGQGKQLNIIGNHLALVEKGRCGPRCAIGDRAHQLEEIQMTRKVVIPAPAKRRAVLDARRKVLDAEQELANAEAGEEGMSEDEAGETGGTHIHLHTSGGAMAKSDDEGEEDPTEARFKKLETGMASIGDAVTALTEAMRAAGGGSKAEDAEEEDEPGKKKEKVDDSEETEEEKEKKAKDAEAEEEKDEKGKTKDSQALQTSFTQLRSAAELLVPGFRMPTFDAKAKRKITMDAMCGARRRALDLALSTKDGATLVTSINGGKEPTLDGMTCVEVATLFNAAAGAKGLLNNRGQARDAATGAAGKTAAVTPKGPMTIDAINKANAAFWSRNEQKA